MSIKAVFVFSGAIILTIAAAIDTYPRKEKMLRFETENGTLLVDKDNILAIMEHSYNKETGKKDGPAIIFLKNGTTLTLVEPFKSTLIRFQDNGLIK